MTYKYNLNVFFNEDALSYYLLGAFMTDGCISLCSNGTSRQIFLSSKDSDWLAAIGNVICKDLPIRKSETGFVLGIYNNELANWFISKGCIERKSLILKFPEVPDEFLPDFIRGCLDGDGCISCCNNKKVYKGKTTIYPEWKCYLCSSSLSFIESYKTILNNKNINNTFTVRLTNISNIGERTITQTSPHYRIITSCTNTYKLLSWAYYPNHQLSLKRKYDLANQVIQRYNQESSTQALPASSAQTCHD